MEQDDKKPDREDPQPPKRPDPPVKPQGDIDNPGRQDPPPPPPQENP